MLLLAVLRMSLVPTDTKLMFELSVLHVKNCLSAMWKLRESVIGDLGVVARRLVVSPLDLR